MIDTALSLVGCGYIYGATGWVCTQARADQQAAQYPQYAESIRKYAPKWMGKRCYDCAQLTKAVAKAAGFALPSGATSQWNKFAWAEKGTMDSLPMDKVVFLYRESGGKMQHTGVYLGDGTFVDARGHQYGVLHSQISSYKWTHWAMLPAAAEKAAAEKPQESAGKEASGTQGKPSAGVIQTSGSPVNQRSTPSTKERLYWHIPNGAEVEVLEAPSGGWVKVRYQRREGYVQEEFVRMG